MKRLSEKETATLITLAAFIFGAWLRLMPASGNGFPLNDGGMFYSMIRDLRLNGYMIPFSTTYNNLNIPFAYPPLAFYLAGWLADIFHAPDQIILLWLPAIINLLTLPAFSLLANSVLKSPQKAALATLFYTLTPLSLDWFLMGGGLTRGLGQLFLLMTCWCVWELFSTHSRRFLAGSILFGALVVLTHPESAILTLTSALIIWAFSKPGLKTSKDALLVGLGVAVLCSPWLLFVIQLHGISPFLNALQTNGSSNLMWLALFSFDFTQESGLALMAVLGLIGLFVKLGEKDYLLPAWVALPFFIDPRSSARAAIIPLAILAAITLLDVVLPAIQGSPADITRQRKIAGNFFLGFLLVYMLFNAFVLDMKISSNRLEQSDLKPLTWVADNSPKDSRFLILTGETMTMRDPIQEWFPALTGRNSQTTLQGLEWTWGVKFVDSLGGYQTLQGCLTQNLACVMDQAEKLHLSFDQIYIKKQPKAVCGGSPTCQYGLITELRSSSNFKLTYEDDNCIIFIQKP